MNLAVTNGASQSFWNIMTLFTSKTTKVIVENPTYFLAVKMLRELGLNMLPCPSNKSGLDLQYLEKILIEDKEYLYEPRKDRQTFRYLLYLVPTFSNPTGATLSEDDRKILIDLARKYDILVVCDDVYQLLSFPSRNKSVPTRLVALDIATLPTNGIGNVISNQSFSKILAPGIRLGFVESSPVLINCLSKAALLYSEGSPNHFTSNIVRIILEDGSLEAHLKMLKSTYESRCMVLCNSLKNHLPNSCTFNIPTGGFFIWIHCKFRLNWDSTRVVQALRAGNSEDGLMLERISYTPGNSFSCDGSHGNFIRISFAMYSDEELQNGAERLGKVLKSCCKEL